MTISAPNFVQRFPVCEMFLYLPSSVRDWSGGGGLVPALRRAFHPRRAFCRMLCHGILGQMQETLLSRVSLGSPWSEAFQGPHPPVSGRGDREVKSLFPGNPPGLLWVWQLSSSRAFSTPSSNWLCCLFVSFPKTGASSGQGLCLHFLWISRFAE